MNKPNHYFSVCLCACVSVCVSDLLKVIADPQRDRRAPITVPGNGPIAGIPQPVPKPLLPYKLRDPGEGR